MSVNIALLGAGRIGRVHAEAIRASKGASLYSVSDAIEGAAQSLANDLGCAVSGVDEAIKSSAVDAVLIASPTNTHADLIEASARSGKAIFCEKPIDLDIARVERCLGVVKECGARLMLGFNRRFDAHFMALKAGIEHGAVGEVEQIQITSRDPAPPPVEYIKVSGGLFRDMMIHDFDMARFLLGEEVTQVLAVGSVLVDSAIADAGDIDTATAVLTTASGKQCVITNSRRASYGYDQRIEVHGSKGMASADNPRPLTVEMADAQGYRHPPLHNFFMTRYSEAYVNEMNHFVAWLSGEEVNVPVGDDGLQALRLADAAAQSCVSGRAVNV